MPPSNPVEELLLDLDARWPVEEPTPVVLRLIGSTALFLQTDYRRGTKDSDMLETVQLRGPTGQQVLAHAGKGSPLHRKHRLYVELVHRDFPFLAEEPRWLPVDPLNWQLRSFSVEVLDVVDIVVAKLKRYNPFDAEDVAAMVARGLVPHERLVERFRSAVRRLEFDARAEDLPRTVAMLHRVERDLLGVDETPIELPAWVSED